MKDTLKQPSSPSSQSIDILEMLDRNNKMLALIVTSGVFIGYLCYACFEWYFNSISTMVISLINVFVAILSTILVYRNRIQVAIALVSLGVYFASFGMQVVYLNSGITLVTLMMIQGGLFTCFFLILGFFINKKQLIYWITGITVLDFLLIPIYLGYSIEQLRNFITTAFVLCVSGILIAHLMAFYHNLLNQSIRNTERERELRNQFHFSVSDALQNSSKISESLSSLFSDISSAIYEMIQSFQNIDENAKFQSEAAVYNVNGINETVSKLNDIKQEIGTLLQIFKRSTLDMNRLSNSVTEVHTITTKTQEGFSDLIHLADTGQRVLEESVEAISNIEQSSQDIRTLNQEINKISENLGVLSINSAIEASKAGTFGRGFSVLATEVRKLTMRSIQSAKKSDDLISTILDRIKIGVESINEVLTIFSNMHSTITNFNNQLTTINSITYEHNRSASDINKALEQSLNQLRLIDSELQEKQEQIKIVREQSQSIEQLSQDTLHAIESQMTAGNQILHSTESMKEVIEQNHLHSQRLKHMVFDPHSNR